MLLLEGTTPHLGHAGIAWPGVEGGTSAGWCLSSLGLMPFPRKPGTTPPGSRHVKGGTRHDSTHRWRESHPRHGPTRSPSGGTGVSPRLHPALADRWVHKLSALAAHPRTDRGYSSTSTSQRSCAPAALNAPARAALCAGYQHDAAPAPGTHPSPGGLRDV